MTPLRFIAICAATGVLAAAAVVAAVIGVARELDAREQAQDADVLAFGAAS